MFLSHSALPWVALRQAQGCGFLDYDEWKTVVLSLSKHVPQGSAESAPQRRLQLVHQIRAFPWEGIARRLPPEMAVGGGLAVDGLVEAKVGADALGRQADEGRQHGFERAFVDRAGAVQIDID